MCILESKQNRTWSGNKETYLWVHRPLSSVVLAAKPPVHKNPPELHVEDDGVASEHANFLLQHGSLLSPGNLVTLKSLQLQTSTLSLQTQTLILLPEKTLGKKQRNILEKSFN